MELLSVVVFCNQDVRVVDGVRTRKIPSGTGFRSAPAALSRHGLRQTELNGIRVAPDLKLEWPFHAWRSQQTDTINRRGLIQPERTKPLDKLLLPTGG